jgi:large subunit ribosomal protein L28
MSRRCALTGTGSLFGHKVSHSNRKMNIRFQPNLQHVSLVSDALGATVALRVTVATLRSIEHNGGLDAYLLKHGARTLTPEAARLRRQIKKKLAKVKAKAA